MKSIVFNVKRRRKLERNMLESGEYRHCETDKQK